MEKREEQETKIVRKFLARSQRPGYNADWMSRRVGERLQVTKSDALGVVVRAREEAMQRRRRDSRSP